MPLNFCASVSVTFYWLRWAMDLEFYYQMDDERWSCGVSSLKFIFVGWVEKTFGLFPLDDVGLFSSVELPI